MIRQAAWMVDGATLIKPKAEALIGLFNIMKSAIARNYEQLKTDSDFKLKVDQQSYSCELTSGFYQRSIIDEANRLLENLNKEIERLNVN